LRNIDIWWCLMWHSHWHWCIDEHGDVVIVPLLYCYCIIVYCVWCIIIGDSCPLMPLYIHAIDGIVSLLTTMITLMMMPSDCCYCTLLLHWLLLPLLPLCIHLFIDDNVFIDKCDIMVHLFHCRDYVILYYCYWWHCYWWYFIDNYCIVIIDISSIVLLLYSLSLLLLTLIDIVGIVLLWWQYSDVLFIHCMKYLVFIVVIIIDDLIFIVVHCVRGIHCDVMTFTCVFDMRWYCAIILYCVPIIVYSVMQMPVLAVLMYKYQYWPFIIMKYYCTKYWYFHLKYSCNVCIVINVHYYWLCCMSYACIVIGYWTKHLAICILLAFWCIDLALVGIPNVLYSVEKVHSLLSLSIVSMLWNAMKWLHVSIINECIIPVIDALFCCCLMSIRYWVFVDEYYCYILLLLW